MSSPCALVWFRNDLRLGDHPALTAAVATGLPLLCLYILEEDAGLRPRGAASRWRLDAALRALAADLRAKGGRLDVLRGCAEDLLPRLAEQAGAAHVFWSRRYGGAEIALDARIKQALRDQGRDARSFNGALLAEPWEIAPKAGGFFRVFTPFWRVLRTHLPPGAPLPAPTRLTAAPWPKHAPPPLREWSLKPQNPDWAAAFPDPQAGEAGAHERLRDFLESDLNGYGANRDGLDANATSRLSAPLHFGEISPRQIVAALADRPAEKFLSELGWREFAHHLLFARPDLPTKAFAPRFEAFAWSHDEAGLEAWRRGRTGYPVVDAAMRELWTTGLMHNRARMIVASFLTKHLLVDWREGERWFWDTLVDADAANNAVSWQWVAGCGADAAPYFRIFNPVLQGEKFDPDGVYVSRYCPELARLPARFIHRPWAAPAAVLAEAGVKIGDNWPAPIIDHDFARRRALEAFRSLP
jgi:deoxyribodipyrimidine photo-lyase